jgi:hypothetical protein
VDSTLADAVFKAATGAQDITATQVFRFGRYSHAIFSSYEDAFYQNQDGLLTDSAFTAAVNTLARVASRPSFRVQWKQARLAYGAEFAAFMDGLVAKTPIEQLSFDPAEWLSALAIERSGTSS